jgi:hypothetical protein
MNSQFELTEQAFLVAYLSQVYANSGYPAPLVARIPKQARASEGEHSNLATRGIVQGMPSVMIASNQAPVIWIEILSRFTQPSEQQRRVHDHLADLGHIVMVCHSAAHALADLRAMGALEPTPQLPMQLESRD